MKSGAFETDVKRSRAALWSIRLALFALALVLVGLVMHRLMGLPTPSLLNLLLVGFALAGLGALFSVIGFIRIWTRGMRGTGAATFGGLIALSLLAWPASYVPTVIRQAPLNDVTTDTAAPPRFNDIAKLRPDGANDITYPGRAASAVQDALYPDLRPLIVARPAAETFELVVQAMTRMGLTIVTEQEPTATTPGRIEATARTLIVGFRDDVAVRVIGRADRSKIDIRSASRFGAHDFGSNANRIRELIRGILERLRSTVPAQRAN